MSYRAWVAAVALGLIALSRPEESQGQIQQDSSTDEEHGQARQPFFWSDQFFNPPPIERPCPPGEDNRYSDLCAQWKAADAAEDSANYALLTFALGVVSLPVAIGTLLAAISAARWARVAGEAGKEAVSVTRDIGIAQARAYLSIAEVKGIEITDGEDIPVFQVNPFIKNAGQSPARDVEIEVTDKKDAGPDEPLPGTLHIGDLGPGEQRSGPFTVRPINYRPERKSVVVNPDIKITYRDVFGTKETIEEGYWRRLYTLDGQWFDLDRSNTRAFTIDLGDKSKGSQN